jgi:hypothetical protein
VSSVRILGPVGLKLNFFLTPNPKPQIHPGIGFCRKRNGNKTKLRKSKGASAATVGP